MKIFFILLVSITFLIISCNNPVEPTSDNSAFLTNLSGQITNWNLGSGYNIALACQDSMGVERIISSSVIEPGGLFSLENLAPPPQSSYGSVVYPSLSQYSKILGNNFECSDSSVMLIWSQLEIRDNSSNRLVGGVMRANVDLKNIYPKDGCFSVAYYYVSKDVKLSGTIKARIFSSIDTVQVELITHYDLNYKKGWNKEVMLYSTQKDFKDSITTVYRREYWLTNSEPSGGMWIYYSN